MLYSKATRFARCRDLKQNAKIVKFGELVQACGTNLLLTIFALYVM